LRAQFGDSAAGGTDGRGTGATGGTGPPATALSLDADTALPASAGAAAAIAFGTQFGALMSNLGVFGGLSPRDAQLALAPKVVNAVQGFCPGDGAGGAGGAGGGGSAIVDWSGALLAGETVIITLQDCEGSPLLSGPTNGTIRFEVERAEGLVFVGTARLDLTSPDADIAGSFSVRTNFNNLFLGCGLGNVAGCEPAATEVVVTAEQNVRIDCFDIYQRHPEFFRPLAVVTLDNRVLALDNKVFTINNYEATPANITFDVSTGVPILGTVRLVSGVGPGAGGPEMPCFNGMPAGDDSFCDLTFNADGCVDINCNDDFNTSAFWDDLLDFDFMGDSRCGTGGTGGSAAGQ